LMSANWKLWKFQQISTFMIVRENNGKIVSMGTGLYRSVSNAEISIKNYVLCSFKLEKGSDFRISPVLVDFRVIRYLY
jgi:hypothetical protein